MPRNNSARHTTYNFLLGLFTLIVSYQLGYAGESIKGFRDLNFGMTPKEVAALDMCSSSSECMYELTNKNRYVTTTYLPQASSNSSASQEPSAIPRLAKITIDMGQYTEAWHQQLQTILGSSYRLTQDITEENVQNFIAKKQDQLQTGYDNGQVVLTVARRTFGNLVLKVIYQNPALAKDFVQAVQAPAASTP